MLDKRSFVKGLLLGELETPALLVNKAVVTRNCETMRVRAANAGVKLRPHLKTSKAAAVAAMATGGGDCLTVSTVAEVAYFARAGYRDITYAVGIVPSKLATLAAIGRETGAKIAVVGDNMATIVSIAKTSSELGTVFEVFIEIDTGGRRAGVLPESEDLIPIAEAISQASSLRLAGVLTHAGHSYHAHDPLEIEAIAEEERLGAVRAATRIRGAGIDCPVVSIGSTPTVIRARSFDGVTEVRPGVYTLFDLTQFCLGVCSLSDIAASVLTTVIGHNVAANMLVVDAGALALSKDASASEFRSDLGFGLVCRPTVESSITTGLLVKDVFQEHGLVGTPDGRAPDWSAYPIGTRLRILPIHVCMTAAAFDQYYVFDGTDAVETTWDKARLWYEPHANWAPAAA